MSSSYPITLLAPFTLLLLLAGCADSPRARPAYASAPQLRSLNESDAIALIDELLREERWQPVPSWTVEVPPRAEPLEVDVRLGGTSFGIEWVSAEDRQRYGAILPPPDPQGQLKLLAGTGGDAQRRPLILLLDHETYRFASRRVPTEGWSDQHDIEEQLRRDLTDFIEYARSQYRL